MAKFCGECGAPLKDDARFCGECGAPVEQPAPAASENPPEAPIPEVPLEAPDAEAPASGEETGYTQEEAPVSGEGAGYTQEEAPVSGEETEYSQAEAPDGEAPWSGPQPEAPAQPAQPRVKKPLPKWAKPVGIAVAAVVVVLVALSLILKGINDPEKVTDKFLTALGDSDFAAVSKVAVAEDEELVLTEENTAPLFKLYNDSMAFRKTVEDLLDEDLDLIEDGRDPNEGYLFDLRAEKKFLHTAYKVVIGTCDTVEISSNLVCDVTLDGGQTLAMTADSSASTSDTSVVFSPDYSLAEYCTGSVYDVLPGLYTVSGTVETSTGATFTAETTVEVSNEYNAYAELNFDYVTIEIANNYDIPVEFYLDGTICGSLAGEGYYEMGPLSPDQMIEARADLGTGEPMTETFSASEGYWSLSFVMCEVEINNDYAAPIQVKQDGEVILEVAPGEYDTVGDLPSGTVLTLELIEGVTEPVEYTCEYEYDYIYPDFSLTDDAVADVQETVSAYVNQMLQLVNERDTAGLEAMAESDFREECQAALESMEENEASIDDGLAYTITIYAPDGVDFDTTQPATYWTTDLTDRPLVHVACYIGIQLDAEITLPDGSTESYSDATGGYYEFILEYVDDVWSIVD